MFYFDGRSYSNFFRFLKSKKYYLLLNFVTNCNFLLQNLSIQNMTPLGDIVKTVITIRQIIQGEVHERHKYKFFAARGEIRFDGSGIIHINCLRQHQFPI